ncbi:FAD-dependent oxidoreductase [Endozoicomonas numazuensis]|uniref:Amine oxidase domain-containing protein n=1 Tax=Endozoicomonas numazuensis TaxID=1137799 RepID=A0A081NCV2_9GAMM|nr:FAD/NAD(P)-binding protein [Endozoicomonas numazuensis]KEQ16275.1 hypothetical protein GZ78_23985 [Endozoicomonas numazuensis]
MEKILSGRLQILIVLGWLFSVTGYGQELSRDVCIIGGGASGMYAALKLADKKYSVAVLEAKGRLGGHAQTYRAEPWGSVYDLGVRIFPESDTVKEVFDRFGQKLVRASILDLKRKYVDFESGALSDYQEPSYRSTLISLFYYWYYSRYIPTPFC